MTKNFTYAAIAPLLLISSVAVSQDDLGNSDDAVLDPSEQTVPVADEEVLPGPAIDATPAETTEEQLLTEFARYRRLLQEGTLDEADVAAKRIVEMAIRIYAPQTRETANALNNLGIVQHGNGQYDAAIQNFTSAVEIIENVEDRLNDALVNPLKGLGAAQLGRGRPDQAKKTYTRAAHITQVNEGPHNLDQIEILESIAETDIRMGDTKSARKILDRIHIINVKHFEKNPLGLLPSLMNRADWQHRAGYYAEERATYRRAIRIIETSAGKNDATLVEPLRRLGQSFYFIDVSMATPKQQGLISTGELYFKRAARIADKSDDMEWRERAATQLALADYYTYIESTNRSRKIYLRVWETLSADDEQLAQRAKLFTDPVAIRSESMPTFATFNSNGRFDGSSRNDRVSGKIVVDYSVSERGHVRDLRTEAFPPEFIDMQRMVHREIRNRVHRPRLADGVPVRAEDLRFEHNFFYIQSELDNHRAAKAKAEAEQEDADND